MKVVFICHGNICRSPMAERVAKAFAAQAGIDAEITSAGVSAEEARNPIDSRAARVLTAAGYDASNHRAQQITSNQIREADLVIGAEPGQVQRLSRMAPDANNLFLLNDFNPGLPKGTALIDPWYGDQTGFLDTLADIEAAMPGIIERMRSTISS